MSEADDFFKLEGDGISPVTPEHAIIFHRTTADYVGMQRRDFLASLHDMLTDDQGEMVLGAGRLLLKDDIVGILRSMLELGGKKVSLLPPNVVSVSDAHIAWTAPAQVRRMIFNIAGMRPRSLSVPWPRLLIVANNQGKLAVAAIKGRGRLSEKTRLYNAPLMNVGNDGDVCTGSAVLPVGGGADDIGLWESVLFDTAFSHVNNRATLNIKADDGVGTMEHYEFWATLATNKAVTFPTGHLVPMRFSLEEFLRRSA